MGFPRTTFKFWRSSRICLYFIFDEICIAKHVASYKHGIIVRPSSSPNSANTSLYCLRLLICINKCFANSTRDVFSSKASNILSSHPNILLCLRIRYKLNYFGTMINPCLLFSSKVKYIVLVCKKVWLIRNNNSWNIFS